MSIENILDTCVTIHKNVTYGIKSNKKMAFSYMQDPPQRPKSHGYSDMVIENFQLWKGSGESCPEGTIPIRRTTEQDVLRAGSFQQFGRKAKKLFRRDSSNDGHEAS